LDQITLLLSLIRYNQNEIFHAAVDLQLSLVLAEIANSVHPSVSSSGFLLWEYFTDFLANATYSPEGTAQSVANECVTNLSHFTCDSSGFSSVELLTVLKQLGHHWKLPEILDITVHENQDLLRTALDLVNKSTYERKKVLFLLSLKACRYRVYLRGDFAKLLFIFGITFSRSEQLTDVAWTRRWESFTKSYNCGTQFDFPVKDAREFSGFIQIRAHEGLDCEAVATEYHSLVDVVFPTDPILKALMSQSPYKGMAIQSQSHFTTDDQSISPSWYRAPSGAHDQVLISV
jgi:hypothetical protein